MLLKLDKNRRFFSPCDLEIYWMTSKNSRASRLNYSKLCAPFPIRRLIEIEVTVRKRSIRVKIGDFCLSFVTLKFDGWQWKTKGHLFYTTSSSNWSYRPETLNSGKSRWFFVMCDLEIWLMTFKNNRAPILCCFKLWALFHSHQLFQTGITVRKCPIWVKIDVLCPARPWNLMDDLEKQ